LLIERRASDGVWDGASLLWLRDGAEAVDAEVGTRPGYFTHPHTRSCDAAHQEPRLREPIPVDHTPRRVTTAWHTLPKPLMRPLLVE
jgi:hypothetical protein